MSERNVYGFCDNNCRFLVYTRDEVLSLLQQAINDGSLQNIDPEYAAISKLVCINGGDNIKFWTGTESQFNALDPAPTVHHIIPRRGEDGTIYLCVDDSGLDNLPQEALTTAEVNAICV